MAMKLYMSSQVMSTQEKEKLIQDFNKIDYNGDGKISREELVKAYYDIGIESSFDVIDSIMEKVDIGGTGFISYSEFVNATISWTIE